MLTPTLTLTPTPTLTLTLTLTLALCVTLTLVLATPLIASPLMKPLFTPRGWHKVKCVY